MQYRLIAAIAALVIPTLAVADRQADLAFEVQQGSSFTKGEVITKLVTLQLGEKCWDKVLDKKHATLLRIGGYAGAIAAYAKQVTGDDWPAIESQSANSKEKNRELVAKMVDDFKPKFHLTVKVEGDDCEKDSALWTKYLSQTTEALAKYPPKAGKAFITINVTAKAKGVKTVVSKDGATFTITGARDIEASGWPNEISNPFLRVSSKK